MDPTDLHQRRIEQLESTLTYLQNDFDQLNGVVLEMNGRLDQIHQTLQRMTLRMESIQEPEVPRDLEDERPPHY